MGGLAPRPEDSRETRVVNAFRCVPGGQWLGFSQAGKHGRQATGSGASAWEATLPIGTPLEAVQIWFHSVGDNIGYSSPALSPDGTIVYVGSYDNKLHAVRSSDGTQIWSYTTGGQVDSSPAVSADGATIFVGSLDIMLTWVILRNGGEEVNPVAKLVIDDWGLNGAIAFKFALTLFVIVACEAIARVRPTTALILIWFGVLISSFPPIWSVFLLITHAGDL